MGEKDIAEKILLDHNDVFSDVLNGLLFDGKPVIEESSLESAEMFSAYKADGKLHAQERDVSKLWRSETGFRLALCGVENQSCVDPDMPLRIISYDGACYRAQLLEHDHTERYPVVTVVLYFGKGHWNGPRSLKDRLSIPDDLVPFVNDYHIQVFEIPYLEDEVVKRFQSDFRIIADYFTQVRKTGTYRGSEETIEHVHEVLQLLSVFTGDDRFEKTIAYASGSGGETNMCKVLDEIENRGIATGMARGMARGAELNQLDTVRTLMENSELGWSVDKIFEVLKIAPEKQVFIREKLSDLRKSEIPEHIEVRKRS